MRKYEYSNDLVNVVKKFLVDDDWHFSFDENTGIFDFGLRIKSICCIIKIPKVADKNGEHCISILEKIAG